MCKEPEKRLLRGILSPKKTMKGGTVVSGSSAPMEKLIPSQQKRKRFEGLVNGEIEAKNQDSTMACRHGVPSHINERKAMKLVFSVLIRVSMPWNWVEMAEPELVEAKLSPRLRNTRKILAPNNAE